MNITTDINILGGLPDWELVKVFLTGSVESMKSRGGTHGFTQIKTEKSVKRFEKAIKQSLLKFSNKDSELLFHKLLNEKGICNDTLLVLFWNGSLNNDLLHYLNDKVYFPALYSGRASLKNDEVEACLKELQATNKQIASWSDITIATTASKYLTLLKKFTLLEGGQKKSMNHPLLDDAVFVLFIYWLSGISEKANLIDSPWLNYAFSERNHLIDKLLQKKYSKYYNVTYLGDKLTIETTVPYAELYDKLY